MRMSFGKLDSSKHLLEEVGASDASKYGKISIMGCILQLVSGVSEMLVCKTKNSPAPVNKLILKNFAKTPNFSMLMLRRSKSCPGLRMIQMARPIILKEDIVASKNPAGHNLLMKS